MKLKCPKCKHVSTIIWSIKGFKLEDCVINFRCNGCDLPASVLIEFDNEQPGPKVTWEDTNYIG